LPREVLRVDSKLVWTCALMFEELTVLLVTDELDGGWTIEMLGAGGSTPCTLRPISERSRMGYGATFCTLKI
jgi:hypothetical protein